MDEESFRRACGTFNVESCTALLAGLAPDEADSASKILERHVRETGCLVEPRITREDEAKRTAFVEFCRNFISTRSEEGILEAFEKHLAETVLLERGYKAVLATLKEFPSGQWDPDVQLWAAFERAAKEIEVTYKQMNDPEAIKGEFFDPVGAKITRPDAPDIDPAFVVSSATNILGSTIMMLAWDNGWNAGGKLIVPNRKDIDEAKRLQAGLTAYLGQMWRVFEQSDDHLRYFGGELVLREGCSVTDAKSKTHTIDVLQFRLGQETNLIDQIAQERLNRAKLGYMRQLEQTTNAAQKVSKAIEGTPLPPEGYISIDEIHSYLVLGDLYCLPVEGEKAVYKGLALKHWLRGYAAIKECLAYENGEPIMEVRTFTETDLVGTFMKAGLTEVQAKAFVTATTFNKGRSDLFDTPFVRSADGNIHFFAPAYAGAQISSILISMLSINGVQFQKKGFAFEEKVRNRLTKSGLNVKTFKFKYQEKQLECDAAFVWDKKLFVFECKNNTLSGSNSIASYHFWQGMMDAVKQLERMRDAFIEDPNRIKEHLGDEVEWDAIILCVINAMPWSPGKLGDIYFYDSSALVKFFDEGVITFEMPVAIAENIIVLRTHPIPLWASAAPTVDDFLKQLEKPTQVQMFEDEWEITAPLALLSKQLGVVNPFLNRKSPDPKRSLKTCGMDDAAIESLLADFRKTSQLAAKLREKLKEKE